MRAYERHTRDDRTFDEWLADCSEWWDMLRGDLAYDFLDLEWREWYEAGLTVEAAVKLADARVYGG